MKRFVRWLIGLGASILLFGLLTAAVYRAYAPGDLEERADRFQRRWEVFTEPIIWRFIGQGILITLQIAVISILLSLVFGLGLALLRLSRDRYVGLPIPRGMRTVVAAPAAVIVQAIRASPLYLLILYMFIAVPKIGLDMGPMTAGIVALTLYTSAVLAEIFRAGILSLEHGQFEAAASLGLRYGKQLRLVVLPQALRRMVPAVVSQVVTLIKDTSLLHVITVLEVYRRLTILSAQRFNPIETSIVAGAIFFVMNFSLSSLARRLEVAPARVGGAAQANLQGIGAEDQTLVVTARADRV
jgi:putative glutamine transport system permease protein